jgi:hypothetical protein
LTETVLVCGWAGYDCFVVVEGEAEVYDIDHDGTEELVATRPVGSKASFLYFIFIHRYIQ